MPWCDDCSKFWTPTSMHADGSCPSCGRVLTEDLPKAAPWHFKLLVVALVLYLTFRLWQGIAWVLSRI